MSGHIPRFHHDIRAAAEDLPFMNEILENSRESKRVRLNYNITTSFGRAHFIQRLTVDDLSNVTTHRIVFSDDKVEMN